MMVTAEELLRERLAILKKKQALATAEDQPERAARFAQLARQLQAELDKLTAPGVE